jgi:hypothetical protein
VWVQPGDAAGGESQSSASIDTHDTERFPQAVDHDLGVEIRPIRGRA